MPLDADTILALLAFVALLASGLLVVVGYQSGAASAAALWALSNLFLALSTVLLLEGTAIELAFLCLGLTAALQWTSIIAFNRRRLPAPWLIGGALAWIIVSVGPVASWDFGPRVALYLSVAAMFLIHAAWELWQHTERLPARRPLLGLLLADIAIVATSVVLVLPMEALAVPGEDGAFVPVYLGSMVFVVGSAVFLMAMIKERAVAEHASAASTDSLTGLMNRGALLAAGASTMARALGRGGAISAVLFDLDRFKSVNDGFGHHTGDIVLRRFAEAAQQVLRPNDLIGRIGGEEFLALIPSVSEEAAIAIADRIRRAFAEAAEWVGGAPVRATVSAGLATSHAGGALETLHELIDRADRALYAAKAAGRNRIATDPPTDAGGAASIIRLA